jgi:hypothetical protein
MTASKLQRSQECNTKTTKEAVDAPLRLVHTTPLPSSAVLTTSKAARYLSMSRTTLLRYTDLGNLVAYDLLGRRVYKIEDLDALLNSIPEWGTQLDRYNRRLKTAGE